jgi:hypothetical protein
MVLGEWLGIYLVGHAFKRVTRHGPQCLIIEKYRDTRAGEIENFILVNAAGIRMDHDASKSFSPSLRIIMLADDHIVTTTRRQSVAGT